jgi:hypothetical protein
MHTSSSLVARELYWRVYVCRLNLKETWYHLTVFYNPSSEIYLDLFLRHFIPLRTFMSKCRFPTSFNEEVFWLLGADRPNSVLWNWSLPLHSLCVARKLWSLHLTYSLFKTKLLLYKAFNLPGSSSLHLTQSKLFFFM